MPGLKSVNVGKYYHFIQQECVARVINKQGVKKEVTRDERDEEFIVGSCSEMENV